MSIVSAGLNVLGTYEMDLAKVVAAQQELAKAQKLLDLPISVHLDLISVQKDMKALRQIYDIYEAQKVGELKWPTEIWLLLIFHVGQTFHTFLCYIFQNAKTQWSQTLWVDLNIHQLQEGVDSFIKTLKQLPKHVRALPVALFLDGQMKEFRESLPLLLDLKNEALRDRSECLLNRIRSWLRSNLAAVIVVKCFFKIIYCIY